MYFTDHYISDVYLRALLYVHDGMAMENLSTYSGVPIILFCYAISRQASAH